MGAPPGLRWRLADTDPGAAADPQGALFDEVVERHVGKGEYRGMEFIHVNARTVINEVPRASRMPFRYTINAYRGCSHACTYCLAPDTPVLLAEGRTRPISDLQTGDDVVGTQRVGTDRQFVATPVIAHWSTVKPGFRVTLADGTELVASGDHRFLTERGWKHVTGTEQGAHRRPHLTPSNFLLGTGRVEVSPATPKRDILGRALNGDGRRRVISIDPLGVDLPMFDITTGTGDFIADGAVSHNCFARPTHEYLGMNIGDDFDRRIVVKVNAVERVRAELVPARWGGSHIAMGTNTDPYQRCEGKYRLTQGVVQELVAARNPFSILTKSTLILRDLDLLAEAATVTEVRANFSIGTLDEEVWRLTEPGTPHPLRRVEAVAKLHAAGVPCGVLMAPILPGLSDRPDQLEAVVKACVEAGAVSVTPLLLHLRAGVKEHYLSWLSSARPDLTAEYALAYPKAYAPKGTQEALSRQVAAMVARHGGRTSTPSFSRAIRRRPPDGAAATPSPEARQLALDV